MSFTSLATIHKAIMACAILIGLCACGANAPFTKSSDASIRRAWKDLHIDSRYHAGLSIYDLQSARPIFGYREDNYFIPASNTKILTMYASLQLLGEQLVAAYHTSTGDSLIIWGGGDPGAGYPDVDSAGVLADFIRSSRSKVFFSNHHFRATRFGKGWAWDDYPYSYQVERNAYPLYGNELWVRREDTALVTRPAYLEPFISMIPGSQPMLRRKESGESFEYVFVPGTQEEVQHVPLAFLRNDIIRMWSEATGKSIAWLDRPFDPGSGIVIGSSRDSLLKAMMQESDNFIAEQLLLSCSMGRLGYMDDKAIIDDVRHTLLATVDDYIQWVDGSGLSRYNLMTPRSIVDVLHKIYDLKGWDYIQDIFPAGGKSGTLALHYPSPGTMPYVFAKSGSLRNNHCLSGYLLTRRGRILIFSFMHNQFVDEPATVRHSMEKLLRFLYDKY